jgi:MoxR-like ATPase
MAVVTRRKRQRSARAPGQPLTGSLGVVGWERLDAVLLAALATEAPLLLVGAHGTAKTLVAERVAAALGLEFRHYNASLLSYDDLVGIPVPDESGLALRFVGTPATVWGAEFVLLDEISRCRPDLQNKLFPLVHERKVAGVPLPLLRHRWAAMNPPAAESGDLLDGPGYLGAEPLDAALADRFSFVVRVPGWADLDAKERRALVRGDTPRGAVLLPAMLEECRRLVDAFPDRDRGRVADYVVAAVDQLRGAGVPLSPRRAVMLARNVVSVHAARVALGGADRELEESAGVALAASLPQTADPESPSVVVVQGSHRQAWELSRLAQADSWRQVLEQPDAVKRVALADRLEIDDAGLAKLVTQALGSVPEQRRPGLATALYLRFHRTRDLTAAAWEPVVAQARGVLEPRVLELRLRVGGELDGWRELLASTESGHPLERRLVLHGYPGRWDVAGAARALSTFRQDLRKLDVQLGEVHV